MQILNEIFTSDFLSLTTIRVIQSDLKVFLPVYQKKKCSVTFQSQNKVPSRDEAAYPQDACGVGRLWHSMRPFHNL